MILQDLIALWQAQPFRAFRLHTGRGVFDVNYPLAVALSPQMHVLVIIDGQRADSLVLDEIERGEIVGKPLSLADAISAIEPETLARNAQILADALKLSIPPAPRKKRAASPFDPGIVSFLGTHASNGVFLVHASVSTREDRPIFSTAGTRWNVHGMEQFENGTSLYLHHLDHPTIEQRIILWPPETGTFESFAEAMPLAKLAGELKKRDERLTASPAKPLEPSADYFRQIIPVFKQVEPDGWAAAFGEEENDDDFDRYEIHLVTHKTRSGGEVNNPYLIDIPAEAPLFDLVGTEWDATFKRNEPTIDFELRYPSRGNGVIELSIDPKLLTAQFVGSESGLPLGFFERLLRNFALYESWGLLLDALRAGPVKRKQPEIILPLAGGFCVELWGGETRFPLPFLQPRFLDSQGRTLLDLRGTTWAASVSEEQAKLVTMRLVSHEEKRRYAPERLTLELDLVRHRVTCPGLKGATTLGMIQAMVGKVRGVKWLTEDLPTWFEKREKTTPPVNFTSLDQKKLPMKCFHGITLLLTLFTASSLVCLAAPESQKKVQTATVRLADTDYSHRWSKDDQHEFTPSGQEDLAHWADMVTVNYYRSVKDGEGLSAAANTVLGNYKANQAMVVKTDSVPRTAEKPAEYLIVVLFPQPDFIEAAFARFKINGGIGCSVVYSHREYGKKIGDQMSAWLKKNGPGQEKALMSLETIPQMATAKP